MPAETSKLSSHFNVILIIMANSLKNGLLITTQKDARCTSPKPHWNEESGRFLLLTKSTCLRLHQRNCGLLHVSLLPSQCLQQFDVMWLLHMKNMLAQMVLPDWKHKQLNELLWSFRRTTCVLRWNVWSSSQSPGSFCSNGASTCTSLTSHDFWWNVLLSALEPASTSAHYAI